MLKLALNSEDIEAKSEGAKLDDVSKTLAEKIMFFQIAIAKINESKQKELLNDSTFKRYWYYLKRIFDTAKYDLSEKEETIMLQLSESSYSNWETLTDEILTTSSGVINGEENDFSSLLSKMNDNDRNVRKNIF